MSSEEQSTAARSAGYRMGAAPIAEPEEVTDVSVQASSVSLNQTASPAPTVEMARDEPDVHVQLGPERYYQQLRDVLARRPFTNLGENVRRKPWWPRRKDSQAATSPHSQNSGPDRWAPLSRFRHRFCPPFRVAEEDTSVAQESEFWRVFGVGLVGRWLVGGWTARCVIPW